MFQGRKAVPGYKQAIRMLEDGKAGEIYVAQDADACVTRQIKEMALSSGVPVTPFISRKKLGRLCGIDVGAAVVTVIKEH